MSCGGRCGDANLGKPNPTADRKKGFCRVCELWLKTFGWTGLIKPNEEKTVEYCYLCNAWICDDCMEKKMKRGLSALLSILKIDKL